MKQLLLVAAVTVMSASAFASKARVSALASSSTMAKDFQSIFAQPANMGELADQATFEWGAASTDTTTNYGTAEGGFIRTMGDSKLGFYLGHQNPMWDFFTTYSGNTTLKGNDNPFNVMYSAKSGDMTWGAGLQYAAYEKKSAATLVKKSFMSLALGAVTAQWEANFQMGLGATGEDTTNNTKITPTGGMQLDGKWKSGDVHYLLSYMSAGDKYENTSTSTSIKEPSITVTSLGIEHKIGNFFYGANYVMSNYAEKVNDVKSNSTTLPVKMGFEAEATSWMSLMGSLTQNVLLGSSKTTVAGSGEADSMYHNTTVAAGATLKFGKLSVDGTLAAGTTGNLNASSLMTNAALNYMF